MSEKSNKFIRKEITDLQEKKKDKIARRKKNQPKLRKKKKKGTNLKEKSNYEEK